MIRTFLILLGAAIVLLSAPLLQAFIVAMITAPLVSSALKSIVTQYKRVTG